MKNVGEASARNQEFNNHFNREKILLKIVTGSSPIIFDVGAHHGQSAEFFSEIFNSPTIYSFEPDPESFQILKSKKNKNIQVHNIALSDINGELDFYRNKISHTNSFYRVNYKSTDSIALAKSKKKSKAFELFNLKTKVNSLTIDNFCEINEISQIDLMKIDVQGAECKVLNGAISTLKFTNTVIVEVCLFDYYENDSSIGLVEEILSPESFRLYSVLEISNNPMNGRTDWVELLYRKIK